MSFAVRKGLQAEGGTEGAGCVREGETVDDEADQDHLFLSGPSKREALVASVFICRMAMALSFISRYPCERPMWMNSALRLSIFASTSSCSMVA